MHFPVLLSLLALVGTAESGPFRPLGFSQALETARAERKPVLAEITADWCSSCKELELKTLSRPEVRRFLAERFVAVQIDGEKGEGPALMKRYHVVGFPTVLVLDAAGREIDRIFDVAEPAVLLRTLEGFLRGRGTVADLERQLAARPGDRRLRFELGTRLAIAGRRHRAVALLADVVMGDIDNRAGLAAPALLTLGKFLFLRGQNDPRAALAVLERLGRAYPGTPEARQVPFNVATAWARLGDVERAVRLLRGEIARAPREGSGYNALAWFHFKERKDLAAAVAAAREGVAAAPFDDGLWDTLAEMSFRAGRREEALEAARRALALKPADPFYRYQVRRFARTPSRGGAGPAP